MQENSTRSLSRLAALFVLVAALTQAGCIAVGYSSPGGWFLWPGGIGLLVLIGLVFLLMRRR